MSREVGGGAVEGGGGVHFHGPQALKNLFDVDFRLLGNMQKCCGLMVDHAHQRAIRGVFVFGVQNLIERVWDGIWTPCGVVLKYG